VLVPGFLLKIPKIFDAPKKDALFNDELLWHTPEFDPTDKVKATRVTVADAEASMKM
jgi:hypothetical protein